MSKTPFSDALMGLMGATPVTREKVLDSLHRCDNPSCVARQVFARDGFITARAIKSIPNTLTEDKEYKLGAGAGNGNWATIDDEGVRYVGVLAKQKDGPIDPDEPPSFYIHPDELEKMRLSLPEDPDDEHGHGKEEKKLSLAEAYKELITKQHNAPKFLPGEVLRVRPGFYTGKMNHGEDWPVVAARPLANTVEDDDGEWLNLTILISDPRDGEVTHQRVNSNRYELAPAEDQFNEEAQLKAATLKGE